MEKKVEPNVGGGLLGLLTVILAVLKVLGYVGFSWIWVFAPIWIPIVAALIITTVLTLLNHFFG